MITFPVLCCVLLHYFCSCISCSASKLGGELNDLERNGETAANCVLCAFCEYVHYVGYLCLFCACVL